MKQFSGKVFIVLLVILTAAMGCSKPGSNNSQVYLPNLSDFTIVSASSFAAGTSSTVNVYCTSIGSGTYTIYFNLTGSNTDSSKSAKLVIANNMGSFQTPVLNNPGATYLYLSSVTNINGGGTAFPPNTIYTLTDSTGFMMATVPGGGTFKANDVLATISGNKLTIRGAIAEPLLTSITLNIDSFNHANGVVNFSNYNVPEVAQALYQIPGGGGLSAHGMINIMTIQPTFSGTFSFTLMDSTTVTSGSFNCATPVY